MDELHVPRDARLLGKLLVAENAGKFFVHPQHGALELYVPFQAGFIFVLFEAALAGPAPAPFRRVENPSV